MAINSMNNQGIRKRIRANQRRIARAFTARKAFTLVELLVVIAISTILLALLFGPVISSFNLTRRARAVAQAQDAARFGLERMSREIGRATYIYDNSLAPVAIPMKAPGSTRNDGLPVPANAFDYASWPKIGYARLDIIQAATRSVAGDVIDPTTGEPVSGAELRPGVRGTRAVRYFLALRNPVQGDGKTPNYYQNEYEFPGRLSNSDDNFNPVVLYRAEYDPRDPNLFNLDSVAYNSNAANVGGFNDPVFFYSDKASNDKQKDANGRPANGKSYGENWRAISTVVLTSQQLDLIRWNRVGAATNRGQINTDDPFASTVAFTPVSVPGDIASPGYSTREAVEIAGGVPTQYLTRFGSWTYPYRITVQRGSSGVGGNRPDGAEPFGTLTLVVNRDSQNRVVIESIDGPGTYTVNGTANIPNTLNASTNNVYSLYNPATHKLFVKTPTLTFAVDTDRGRIETAFPPLMGNANQVPYYINANTGAIGAMTALSASPAPPFLALPLSGDVIPTKFMISTRDPQAGQGGVPRNQGIIRTDVLATTATYYPVDTLPVGTYPLVSPLSVFGYGTGPVQLRGIRIIPGTERVMAPTVTGGTPISWTRFVPGLDGIKQPTGQFDVDIYKKIPEREPKYVFEDMVTNSSTDPLTQILTFDTAGTGPGDGVVGMAAGPTPANNPDVLEVTYLWQNNYSRDPRPIAPTWGRPMDAAGRIIEQGSVSRPEADIFRVDYATRSQYTISLGARVYDPSSSQIQTIQVSDKVLVNNAIR